MRAVKIIIINKYKGKTTLTSPAFLRQLLLFTHISDPYLIQKAQPLCGCRDDPCSWGGESWSFCSDVVSHDRQQGRKEGKGRRGRPQRDPPGPDRGEGGGGWGRGDQPFLLLPSSALGQLSNQVTSLSHVASGQSPPHPHLHPSTPSPRRATAACSCSDSSFDGILFVPSCWPAPSLPKQMQTWRGPIKIIRIFHVGDTQ